MRNIDLVTKGELFEIEYNIVSMPGLIHERPERFMKLIQEASNNDLSFLEIPVIQMVINFKWQHYTKGYFMWQLAKNLIFLASFILDLIFMNPKGLDEGSHESMVGSIVTRSICGVIMLDHLHYEVKQLKLMGFKGYFTTDFWNTIDALLIASYASYVPIAFCFEFDYYAVRALQCGVLFLFAIKLNFYLRIFDKMGFLVQMIVTVFYDLGYFLLYFCIILSFFTVSVSLILRDVDEHGGIGDIKYFVMTLRTSLGDMDIDQSNTEFKILFWTIYVLIILVGNIVLMNFIIAVVGQSYGECMAQMVAQSYKVKVDMIVERESMMHESFNNPLWFPQYILVRQPVNIDALNAIEAKEESNRMRDEIAKMSDFQKNTLMLAVDKINKDAEEANKSIMEKLEEL